MRARYVKSEWENTSRTIASLYFKPDKPYYFAPGQYTDLTVPHDNPDRRGLTRTMTISSSPDKQLLRITTRLSKDNTSSYKQALRNMPVGGTVHMTDAMGDMILPIDPNIPLIFVAGGVGIASYTAIIEHLLQKDEHRDITLLYAARSISDIAFVSLIDAYASNHDMKYRVYLPNAKISEHSAAFELIPARLTAQDIAAAMSANAQIYLSGSESMVEQFRSSLYSDYRIPQYQVAFDYFDGYIET